MCLSWYLLLSKASVRCIIPQDPARPLEECSVVWSDEVNDIKVENLVMLIYANQTFTKDMFKGGATKADVDRMRVLGRAEGKKTDNGEAEVNSSHHDG